MEDKTNNFKQERLRLIKNSLRYKVLMTEFDKDPNWDKLRTQQLSEQLNLTRMQVYKWNFDQRRRTIAGSGQ